VGCELEEKERFWSELDEVMESIPTGERVVIGADFNGHVGEGNTGDEEVMGKFGVKERNLEGQMAVDFAKRMDMAVVNTYFQKREEHRVTYKSGGRRTQVVLPDDWETTAEVIRETGRKVLGVSSGRRKEDKETWWWNEEVQDSIQRKRLAKKKWDMDRTEENRQEYKELQRRVKREVSKAKQKAYDELYTRLDTREGEKDLYRLAKQRDRDVKDVQQVRVIKDRDGRVLTSEESGQRRWKEYFEELMNEENEREKRVEGVNSVEQKVDKIRKDEVRKALKRMKSGKAVGPDDIPVEVWKCLGEAAVEFLTSLFNRVLESERMPEEWRRSVLVPIFKNKGDVQSCSNYRGIKLMSHTMKLWERVVEARLRKVVEICEQQYGFMPRKSTTDVALRILMEKYRDGQRELHCVFVDLEKAYDRAPREELWYCMRKSGVAEKYVRVVQDMYERSRTVVRCAVGQTEEFKVEVGLHQGSALSPFLFAIVMDQLSEEVRQESPWTMMFADDIVICSESRDQMEENLERWRFALERRGMKVSGSKTEYMCVNEREGSGTVRLQGEEVKKVQEFKYLGSTVQSNGECGKEKISARIKGKVYRTVVRAAMLYGLETVSLRKRQESELEVAELKMLREARLRWFGHVQRRESEYIGRRMLDMELPGRRQRGRPKRRRMAQNRTALQRLGITHILNAAHSKHGSVGDQKFYGTSFVYCGIPADDSSHFDLDVYFRPAAEFIHKGLKTVDGKVLVHCIMGMSRSSSLVLAYLMLYHHMSLCSAIQRLVQKRAIYPNRNFLALLLDLDLQLKRKHKTCILLNTLSSLSGQMGEKGRYETPPSSELHRLLWLKPDTSNHLDEVRPGIYIGDLYAAKDRPMLQALNISHVLNAAHGKYNVNTGPSYYRGTNITYHGVEAFDTPSFDMSPFFYSAAKYIKNALSTPGGKVFVHCAMGLSRSATLVLAYLMIEEKMTLVEAITAVAKNRNICPNTGFLEQLRTLDTQLQNQHSTL
ncbi:hypothetical protein QTP70_029338, partial [Hemibagrus guttatus]